MKIDIEELKRLAEAATPGPWVAAFNTNMDNKVCHSFGDICQTGKDIGDAIFIAAANPAAVLELIRQRDAALGGLGLFMDAVDRPPERNCSCHISPPCNDCVENSGLREAFDYADEVLNDAATSKRKTQGFDR